MFHRVVSPEMADIITASDKNLQIAFLFMVKISTVIEEMTAEICKRPTMAVSYNFYQLKINRQQRTYEGMWEDFMDTIFKYSDRVP